MKAKKRKFAFTLIEMLIVILILGVLLAIAIPKVTKSSDSAKQKACDTNIRLLYSALATYAADNDGQYPRNNNAFRNLILNSDEYFQDEPPTCPFGGSYRMDSTTKEITCTHNN